MPRAPLVERVKQDNIKEDKMPSTMFSTELHINPISEIIIIYFFLSLPPLNDSIANSSDLWQLSSLARESTSCSGTFHSPRSSVLRHL